MILVTGGTGFVGSHVVKTLVDNGHTPIITTRDSSSFARLEGVLEKVRVFNLSEKPLEQVFEEFYVETIIHLATYYRKSDSEVDDANLIEANLNFPLRLLRLGVEAGVKRFINTNTYFQLSPFPVPISPANDEIPFNLYAQIKMDFKQKLKSYCGKVCVVNIFLFTPYGPMDNHKLVDSVIRASLTDGSLSLSEGLQKLDLIYVDDVASAYLAACNSKKFDQQAENELVVATGFPVSVRDVVSVVEELTGKTIHKTWEKSVNNDYRLVYGDTTIARQLIDWEPKTSLHQGIRKTIQFVRSQVIYPDG